MTLAELWKIIAALPLDIVWSILGILTGILVASFFLGFRIAKLLHAHELVGLKSKISKLEDDLRKLGETPRSTLSLQSTEEPLTRLSQFLRYSLSREPFIHPRIIEELRGWLSEELPDIASVDVEAAMKSNNKYADPVKIEVTGQDKWVTASNEKDKTWFSYRYLGVSPSGIHALLTADSGGGSGRFFSVLFLVFQSDDYADYDHTDTVLKRDRILLKCVGQLTLGDRYDGDVTFIDGKLSIGPRRIFFPEYQPDPRILIVE